MVAGPHQAPLAEGDLTHDREAKAAAIPGAPGPGGVPPVKTLEHAIEIGFAEARSVVTNGDEAPAVPFFDAQVNAPPVGAVAQGVVDQVEDCLVQPGRFNADLSGLVALGLDLEFDAPRDREFLQGRPGLTNDVPGVEGGRVGIWNVRR